MGRADGFIFDSHRDNYNPWLITNYLDKGSLYHTGHRQFPKVL